MAVSPWYPDYQPSKPARPRKRKIKKYTKIVQSKSVSSRRLDKVVELAQAIIDANDGLTLSDITVQPAYYTSSTEVRWSTPESDADFNKRVAKEEKQYKADLEHYEKVKKEYDEEVKRAKLESIGKAVTNHDAAINTIAEVLKKYPDVLEKAVTKAMKK